MCAPPPPQGYFLETIKNVLVFSEANLQRGELFFKGRGLTTVAGSRYLGGYLGDDDPKVKWTEENVYRCADDICTLAQVAHKHLPDAYAGL